MGGGPSRVECVLPLMLDRSGPSSGGDAMSELLQWRVGSSPSENAGNPGHSISDHFQLLDVEHRVEVRRSGSYRLRLHVEQQEDARQSGSASCISSKFAVEINGKPIIMYRNWSTENGESSSRKPKSDDVESCTSSMGAPVATEKPSCVRSDHAADATPWKYFGVAEVNLDRCDTIAVRRTLGSSTTKGMKNDSKTTERQPQESSSKLLFGRFVIEAIRTSP